MLRKGFLSLAVVFSAWASGTCWASISVGSPAKREEKAARHLVEVLKNRIIVSKDKKGLSAFLQLTNNPQNVFFLYRSNLLALQRAIEGREDVCSQQKQWPSATDMIEEKIHRLIHSQCEKFFFKKLLSIKSQSDFEHEVKENLDQFFHIQKENGPLLRKTLARIQKKGPGLFSEFKKYVEQKNIRKIPKEIMAFSKIPQKKSSLSFLKRNYNLLKKQLLKDNKRAAYKTLKDTMRFFSLNVESFEKEKSWPFLLFIGRELVYSDEFSKAREVFALSALTSMNDEQYSLSIFSMLWAYLLNGENQQALQFIKDEGLEKKFDRLGLQAQYWIAKIYQNHGQQKRSQKIYKKIIGQNPLSYYAILAKKEIGQANLSDGKKILKSLYQGPRENPMKEVAFSQKELDYFKRYKIFSSLGATHYALGQLEGVLALTDHLPKARSYSLATIEFLYQENDFLNSFKIFLRSINKKHVSLDTNVLSMIFPEKYKTMIDQLSGNLNPILYLSLIRQESAFNPNVISRVGARGLMQLMPKTARQLKKGVSIKALSRPLVNLELGIKYFQKLVHKYDGNLIYAFAAYNAGEARIKRWSKRVFKSDDPLITIESIPFKETRSYVKLIYRNLFFYEYLSRQEGPFFLGLFDHSFSAESYREI